MGCLYRMMLLVSLCVPAVAQELESGDFMLEACKGFVMGEAQRPLSQRLQGICIGTVIHDAAVMSRYVVGFSA